MLSFANSACSDEAERIIASSREKEPRVNQVLCAVGTYVSWTMSFKDDSLIELASRHFTPSLIIRFEKMQLPFIHRRSKCSSSPLWNRFEAKASFSLVKAFRVGCVHHSIMFTYMFAPVFPISRTCMQPLRNHNRLLILAKGLPMVTKAEDSIHLK
jgi:hypothetical protein